MKVAREGWPFVAVPGVIAVGLLVVGRRRLATPFAAASLASLGFFRDPDRTPPAVVDAVLSPADGRVVDVVRVQDPFVGDAFRVSIFLSPLDVHVNRASWWRDGTSPAASSPRTGRMRRSATNGAFSTCRGRRCGWR